MDTLTIYKRINCDNFTVDYCVAENIFGDFEALTYIGKSSDVKSFWRFIKQMTFHDDEVTGQIFDGEFIKAFGIYLKQERMCK